MSPASDSGVMVCVIIPSRNYGRFLEEAVESVLRQTLSVSEIIIVDDGSEDETKAVAEKYSEKVMYFHLNNKGVGAARNLGIKRSSGEFIAHLDADDFWVPEKLELQMEEFRNDPELEIAGGMMQPFFDKDIGEMERKSIFCSPDPLPGFSASVILVRRCCFLKTGFYREDVSHGQDLDWFARARELSLKEKMVGKKLAYRRLHKVNCSNQNKEAGLDRLKALKRSMDRKKRENRG